MPCHADDAAMPPPLRHVATPLRQILRHYHYFTSAVRQAFYLY